MKEEENKLPESTVHADIFWDITMRQIILLIAILIFVTAALVAPSSAATNANIVITDVSPTELSPGDIKEITLTVKNQGGRDARHITMNFQNSDHISLIGSSTVYISSINAWCSKEIPITIKADDELTNGAYAILILVTFSECYHNASVGYVTTPMPSTNITIVFYVEGTTTLGVADISTDPPELREESENNNITVLIENSGSAKARSVSLRMDPSSPFVEAYSGSTSGFTEEIEARSSHSFVFALDIEDGAEEGSYTIPLTIEYIGEDAHKFPLKKSITLKISPQADFLVGEITTEPAVITRGKTFRMNVPVKNNGNKDAKSVKVILKTKSYFTGAKTDYLGEIEVGSAKIATFELEADRDTIPDNYENDLKLIWTEGDERLETIKSFRLVVASKERADEGVNGGFIALAGIGFFVASLTGTFVYFKKKKE
ncbi:MAG: CARDB domain-containing protein [Euryarchaeota archaeon]|nr:CARDB domain-containing protein [Euryarchaeota archaeon]